MLILYIVIAIIKKKGKLNYLTDHPDSSHFITNYLKVPWFFVLHLLPYKDPNIQMEIFTTSILIFEVRITFATVVLFHRSKCA